MALKSKTILYLTVNRQFTMEEKYPDLSERVQSTFIDTVLLSSCALHLPPCSIIMKML